MGPFSQMGHWLGDHHLDALELAGDQKGGQEAVEEGIRTGKSVEEGLRTGESVEEGLRIGKSVDSDGQQEAIWDCCRAHSGWQQSCARIAQ